MKATAARLDVVVEESNSSRVVNAEEHRIRRNALARGHSTRNISI